MSAVDVITRTGDTHAIGHHPSCRRHGDMRALTLVADRRLAIADMPAPPPPGAGEVQIRIKAVALKRIESRQVFGKIVVGF
jgi:hypothetical protein